MNRLSLLLCAVTLLLPGAAEAQRDTPARILTITGVLPSPMGDLADQVDTGKGIALASIWTGAPDRAFALRLDGGWTVFDTQSQHICVANETGGCRSEFDIERKNSIVFAHFGPQVMRHNGVLRPYANVGAGFARFSSAAPSDYIDVTDITLSLTGGLGLLVPITGSVMLDGGARFMYNGSPEYVIAARPASEEFGYFGRSASGNLMQFHLGISIGYASYSR